MRTTPVGQKWVVTYTTKTGDHCMGMTDHYKMLPNMITDLLLLECRNIHIVDKTFYKDDNDDTEKGKLYHLQGRG